MFPLAAFLGILWSFTPLFYVFLSAVSEVFFGPAITGYMVIFVFSSIFLYRWIEDYLAAEHYRYEYYPIDSLDDSNAQPPADLEA